MRGLRDLGGLCAAVSGHFALLKEALASWKHATELTHGTYFRPGLYFYNQYM